jgi:cytochrome c oxidase cbb3-type subunit 2
MALGTCTAAALLTLLRLNLAGSVGIALLIGCGLGLLTVTVATHLRLWIGYSKPLLKTALGTGIGYLICNFPPLFNGSPQAKAITAGGFCLLGMLSSFQRAPAEPEVVVSALETPSSFLRVLTCFTALVWLDSAAFFIIQNTPALKAGTWQGTFHLWSNGWLHLAAALAAAWFLRRRSLWFLLALAYSALAIACLLLLNPARAVLASVFYPVGVSLYSVALVAYPSLLAPASSTAARARMAGWIYAVAGWFGSAMGIGMGQNLGLVPPAFVIFSGLLVLAPELFRFLRRRKRELAVTGATLLAALCLQRTLRPLQAAMTPPSEIERGRQVYISEGCIHCHSQYVRPNSADVLLWGPVQSVEELRRQRPPLIGNRRQGPDLSQVGSRRSALWLRAHFSDPAAVSRGSIMPSYAFLFGDHRGDELLAYVESLHAEDNSEHRAAEKRWKPSTAAVAQADAGIGARLFDSNCATCHTVSGQTRQTWRANLKRLPPLFPTGPFLYLLDSDTFAQRRLRIARIVKFGLPGTDMPGHEYFSDSDIASLSLWLTQHAATPMKAQPTTTSTGEEE